MSEELIKLIEQAQQGDKEALNTLIERFIPLIKKYGSQLAYDEAESDLILWLVKVLKNYGRRW